VIKGLDSFCLFVSSLFGYILFNSEFYYWKFYDRSFSLLKGAMLLWVDSISIFWFLKFYELSCCVNPLWFDENYYSKGF
jgi:hypothetical protein